MRSNDSGRKCLITNSTVRSETNEMFKIMFDGRTNISLGKASDQTISKKCVRSQTASPDWKQIKFLIIQVKCSIRLKSVSSRKCDMIDCTCNMSDRKCELFDYSHSLGRS